MDAKILTAAKIVSSLLASSNEISGLDLMEDDEKVGSIHLSSCNLMDLIQFGDGASLYFVVL